MFPMVICEFGLVEEGISRDVGPNRHVEEGISRDVGPNRHVEVFQQWQINYVQTRACT